ncbi:MAG: transcriptional regulator [Lachnospiraceae bacterium]|nr:transcriptional regulator [Lachnospiraceae bacterium]
MKNFYTSSDVMSILGVGESKAYKVIKLMNDELKRKGFITVRGRVSRKYFEERVYGVVSDTGD